MSVRGKWATAIVLGFVMFGLLVFQGTLRTEYHKWRLQALKEKRQRYMTRGLSGIEKFWLNVTGKPMSSSDLETGIQAHQDALVNVGFLRRQAFEAQRESTSEQASNALAALRVECRWFHAQTVSGTNFVITVCPKMMDDWCGRAPTLGWKIRGKQ